MEKTVSRKEGTWTRIAIIAAAAVLVLLPLVVRNQYISHVVITCFIYIVLTFSLNLIIGWGGMFSLGHACFYGMGAYTTSLLMLNSGMNFWLASLISIGFTAALGAVLCMPTLKLRGDYLAVLTLGFGEVFRLVLTNWTNVTRGPKGLPGIPRPVLFGLTISTRNQFYYFGLILLAAAILFMVRLDNSGFGLAVRAMKEDDVAATAIGIYPVKFKLIIFVTGAVMAGIMGSYFAVYSSFISPSNFTYGESIDMCAMVVLGGTGSIFGSILGAVILTVLPEVLRAMADYRMVIYGAAMVIMMIVRPMGFWGEDKRRVNAYKAQAFGGSRKKRG